MPESDQNLTVRRSTRRMIGLAAEVEVAPEHEELVRLAGGAISATAVDMSEGGIGVLAAGYLPKRCLATVRVMSPINDEQVLFTAKTRVARAVMVDRRPGYQLGLLFEDETPDFQDRLATFLQQIDEAA
jgi:c-di-GMP-binding flagellar brake protein YcgR